MDVGVTYSFVVVSMAFLLIGILMLFLESIEAAFVMLSISLLIGFIALFPLSGLPDGTPSTQALAVGNYKVVFLYSTEEHVSLGIEGALEDSNHLFLYQFPKDYFENVPEDAVRLKVSETTDGKIRSYKLYRF